MDARQLLRLSLMGTLAIVLLYVKRVSGDENSKGGCVTVFAET
jgi:hypothetical protein